MNVADVLTIIVLGLVVCVAGYNFLGEKKSEPANDLVDPNQTDRSTFNRMRLPRNNPHLWADQIEDWYVRIKGHIYFQYTLIGAVVVALLIHVMFGH